MSYPGVNCSAMLSFLNLLNTAEFEANFNCLELSVKDVYQGVQRAAVRITKKS